MQLRTARLCLDCEELHEEQQCPLCASETFVYISRWVPAPERRTRARPQTTPEVAAYRRVVVADALRPKAVRLLKQGAVGLAVVSLARWVWRRRTDQKAVEAKRSVESEMTTGGAATRLSSRGSAASIPDRK